MKLTTKTGDIELTDGEAEILRGSDPVETRKGLVVDLNGKPHGEKKATSLRQRDVDLAHTGQMYFKGPNRKCAVEKGTLEDGTGVDFLRVHWTEPGTAPAPIIAAPVPVPENVAPVKRPFFMPTPVAPRVLETLEDAEYYHAFFSAEIPEGATVNYGPTVPIFPARKRPVSYWAEKLGFGLLGGNKAVWYLRELSAAMVAGDEEGAAIVKATRTPPKWPGWMPEPGTPEFEAMEV